MPSEVLSPFRYQYVLDLDFALDQNNSVVNINEKIIQIITEKLPKNKKNLVHQIQQMHFYADWPRLICKFNCIFMDLTQIEYEFLERTFNGRS